MRLQPLIDPVRSDAMSCCAHSAVHCIPLHKSLGGFGPAYLCERGGRCHGPCRLHTESACSKFEPFEREPSDKSDRSDRSDGGCLR